MEIWKVLAATLMHEPELLDQYAAECSIPTLGPPNPQWEIYYQMEAAGVFQLFAVYADGKMVGFAGVLSTILPHYGVKAATVESLYVLPEFRSKGAGASLLSAIEAHARQVGCKAILYSAPAGGQLEALLGKRHTRTNSVFCKPLT